MKPNRSPLWILTWLFALMVLTLAACAPALPSPAAGQETPLPQTGVTQPPVETPITPVDLDGLSDDNILVQLTYEPGFTMPQYSFAFGRTPFFTLYDNGLVIYVDDTAEFKLVQAQMTPEQAKAFHQQILDMGFEKIESHTDMCGLMPDGSEACVADASTNVMRVRLPSGELREIKNYAGMSKYPSTYGAIYDMMQNYTHPQAELYRPKAATLFVQIVPQPEGAAPASWPLDEQLVAAAEAAAGTNLGFIAVPLTSEQVNQYLAAAGHNNQQVTFQLEGKPVAALFVPWLPGEDFSEEIAKEFPAQ